MICCFPYLFNDSCMLLTIDFSQCLRFMIRFNYAVCNGQTTIAISTARCYVPQTYLLNSHDCSSFKKYKITQSCNFISNVKFIITFKNTCKYFISPFKLCFLFLKLQCKAYGVLIKVFWYAFDFHVIYVNQQTPEYN